MKKRLICIFLIGCTISMFTGCGSKTESISSEPTNSESGVSEPQRQTKHLLFIS